MIMRARKPGLWTAIGATVGLTAGYYGGRVDAVGDRPATDLHGAVGRDDLADGFRRRVRHHRRRRPRDARSEPCRWVGGW